MLGAIIGDIVGSYYEVEEVTAIKNTPDKKRSFEERIKILNPQTPLFTNNCSYTDDTVLTSAIVNSLIRNQSFEESLRNYGLSEISLGLDKYGRSRFGKGFVSWLKNEKVGDSFGNGAAMRISPIAHFYDDLDIILQKTKEATIPSHNNEEAIIGAQAVTTAIYLAKNHYSKEEIKKELQDRFKYNLDFSLSELQHNYRFSSQTSLSIPQALFCFLESNNFEDCLRKSISIGGDTDTIAAISCSIAEVFYGIPKDIKEKAISYLPEKYKKDVIEFYNILNLKKQLVELDICNEEFWSYMQSRVKRITAASADLCGVFTDYDNNILKNIRIIVPEIVDEQTLLINIHEYAHAYELYCELGTIYQQNIETSEQHAREKEQEYLSKKKIYDYS